MILVIKVDISRIGVPTQAELDSSGHDDQIDYWKDVFRLNPQGLMRWATFEVEED